MVENYPGQGEIVIATVKKTTDFGAFCTLDEFNTQDAFIHVSEVSPGWVRSVRDHVKEGQRLVALVLRVDTIKRQIDLSLKRLSEAEKKRKMEAYNLDKRAFKLLERAAVKMGRKPEAASREVVPILKAEYGDLYTVFELASEENKALSSKLPKAWVDAITAVAKIEIKPKLVTLRAVLKLKSYAPDGVEQVKKALKSLQTLSSKMVNVEVHYVGAPRYLFNVTAPDYKTAEKVIAKAEATLAATTASDALEFELSKK